jgi:hypothetical protein
MKQLRRAIALLCVGVTALVAAPPARAAQQVYEIEARPAVLDVAPPGAFMLNLTAILRNGPFFITRKVNVVMTDVDGHELCRSANAQINRYGVYTDRVHCSVLLKPARARDVLEGGSYTATIVETPDVYPSSDSAPVIELD